MHEESWDQEMEFKASFSKENNLGSRLRGMFPLVFLHGLQKNKEKKKKNNLAPGIGIWYLRERVL